MLSEASLDRKGHPVSKRSDFFCGLDVTKGKSAGTDVCSTVVGLIWQVQFSNFWLGRARK